VSVAGKPRRTLGEIAFSLALDGALRMVLGTVGAVRFVRKMRRRYQARR